ncbi:hypothetical protein OO009_05750 [Flavobacteriaceae bacterium KMM 6897]|nr:hypothetical protein [Flavobacteriaceae bacterium KMM 6897]
MDRALHIKMKDGLLSKFKACDLLISPNNLSGYGTFSFKSADIIYELGYKAAMEAMQSKKGLLILNKV